MDGFAALIVGAYLAAVVYHGNTDKLLQTVKDEKNFIPFAISAFVLWFLVRDKPTRSIGVLLVMSALMALGIKIIGDGSNTDTMAAFKQFGSGKIGMFELIKQLSGV